MNTSEAIVNHIAFIPDGNRRWARNRGLPTLIGHKAGYDVIKQLSVVLPKYGVKYASFFCFSMENWQRTQDEVGYLMDLFCRLFEDSDRILMDNGVKVRVIGDLSKLSAELQDKICALEERTRDNDKITVVGAVSYSGRDEIVRSAQKAAKDVLDGKLNIEDLNETTFLGYLDCPDIPYPDILVRTSEQRISNFLLWQTAYSEIMFLDKFWPDISEDDIKYVMENFSKRKRRYGK
ncbi:MAG: di-trans,poly-cis-decaprenylcistransferase [Alphaproteobacteria bacterium]|nr:di-trans,poly-cis-decaprenylcistransferase [Alphaproteobacteria bacterium]